VYDITAEETLQDIDFWVREVQYYLLRELEEGMPVLFVGNKKDLVEKNVNPGYRGEPRDSSSLFRQIQEISNSNGYLRPLECSAKTGNNVQRIFNTIAHELVRRKQVTTSVSHTNVVQSRHSCSDMC
jgi:GTPase SAR1 family protein